VAKGYIMILKSSEFMLAIGVIGGVRFEVRVVVEHGVMVMMESESKSWLGYLSVD